MLSCLLSLLSQCYQSRVWWHMSSFLLLNYLKIVFVFLYIFCPLFVWEKCYKRQKTFWNYFSNFFTKINSMGNKNFRTLWKEKTLNVSNWCQYIHIFFNFKVKNIWSIMIFSFDKRHWVLLFIQWLEISFKNFQI